jgi:putative intracellular protease/amidase
MYTLGKATALQRKLVEFRAAGKVAAALRHGAAILTYARLAKGEHPVRRKAVTGLADAEDEFADAAVWSYGLRSRDKHVMPWRIEDRLEQLGANYVWAGLWCGFAIRRGSLITGQQNFSREETARAIVAALGE